jgi:hypothetical protein
MIWPAESAQFGLVEAVIGLTPLFETSDLQRMVDSFLPEGSGKATFEES